MIAAAHLAWRDITGSGDPLGGTQLDINQSVPFISLQVVGVGVLTGTLALVAVAARLYTKLRITKSVGVDDCACSFP